MLSEAGEKRTIKMKCQVSRIQEDTTPFLNLCMQEGQEWNERGSGVGGEKVT